MDEKHLRAIREFLLHDWDRLILPIVVLLLTLGVSYVIRRILMRAMRKWVERTGSAPVETFMKAIAGPFMIWALILGVHLGLESSDLPEKAVLKVARVLLILWVLSLSVVFARLAGNIIRLYGRGVSGAVQVTTLTQNLAQLSVYILGLMILLNLLGIDIRPILTALGVGGLAVALALQDTLSNLFAGFYIAVAGQVRLGDYIRLHSGEEGYIVDISWRSTTVRALAHNLIIIPNSKLAQANVTNFHMPEKRMAATVQVNVEYSTDIQVVLRVLLEEALGAAAEVPGMLGEPAPNVKFDPGFGESALQFTVNFQVAEFADQFEVRNQLRQRVWKRLKTENIGVPFPTRTVYVVENRH